MLKRLVLPTSLLAFFTLVSMGAGCEPQYANLGDDYPTACPGQCVPLPPLGFDGPALLWVGDPAEVPACPERAPAIVFEGYEGLNNLPLDCAPCACSPPSCRFPEGVTASNLACPGDGPGAVLTPFVAPAPWDGTCVTPAPVSPGLVASLTPAPTSEEPCTPIVDMPEKTEPGPLFTIRARACGGEVHPDLCQDPGHTCVPTAEPPPPGFRQCILSLRPGETSCPLGYPEEISLFAEVIDNRGCTTCTCAQTAPSQCVARLDIYDNASCSGGLSAFALASAMPNCENAMPVQTLRSMRATWQTNQPGTCVPGGGAPTGEVTLTGLQTFCCEKAPPGSAD